tara:strand:+ start:125 stop:262 length:138 start_codon:yes stop_codon:yes gene_type:complete
MKIKKYSIIIEGIEYGASGHNLSKKEFDSLINTGKKFIRHTNSTS